MIIIQDYHYQELAGEGKCDECSIIYNTVFRSLLQTLAVATQYNDIPDFNTAPSFPKCETRLIISRVLAASLFYSANTRRSLAG